MSQVLFAFRLFYGSIHHAIQNMFLTDQIKDQDWQKCQQVRSKCQIVVRSKLCLEIKLCKRQCILSGS